MTTVHTTVEGALAGLELSGTVLATPSTSAGGVGEYVHAMADPRSDQHHRHYHSLPSRLIEPTLHGLRALMALDRHQREQAQSDALQLHRQLARLHSAARLLGSAQDDYDRLHELYRKEQAREFAHFYERHGQSLEATAAELLQLQPLSTTAANVTANVWTAASAGDLTASNDAFLNTMGMGARRTCLRFITYLRTNPAMIANILQRMSDEELLALLPSNGSLGHFTAGATEAANTALPNSPRSPAHHHHFQHSRSVSGSGHSLPGAHALGAASMAGTAATASGLHGHAPNSEDASQAYASASLLNAPANVIDLLLYGLFATADSVSERHLHLQLWTTIFVRLITERRAEHFLLEVLTRYVRCTGWSIRGALETQLMKILRRGQEIILGSGQRPTDGPPNGSSSQGAGGRSRSNSGSGAAPEVDSAAADAFFDHACEEILSVLDLYLPNCLFALTRCVLAELPGDLRQYAIILFLVKFFFFRFLGRAITFPEYYGMCDDYYVSEEQRQAILFKTNQRLYRYATVVCSAAPGWEKVAIGGKIRVYLERIIARFSMTTSSIDSADFFHPHSQAEAAAAVTGGAYIGLALAAEHAGHSPTRPTPLLTPTAEALSPPIGLFAGVTPTLLISAGDLLTLHEFMSLARNTTGTLGGTGSRRSPPVSGSSNNSSSSGHSVRRHYSFSYASSPAAAAISAIDSREEFYLLFTQMTSLLEEIRHRRHERATLLYVCEQSGGPGLSLHDPQTALNTPPTGSAATAAGSGSVSQLPKAHHSRDLSDTSTLSTTSTFSSTAQLALNAYDDAYDDEEVEEASGNGRADSTDPDDTAPAELYTISAAVFRALTAFDMSGTSTAWSVEHFLEAAVQATRIRGDYADSVQYQHALDTLRRLPTAALQYLYTDSVANGHRTHTNQLSAAQPDDAAMIRFMARRYDRAMARRRVRQQYRDRWWAWVQDRRRRLQESLARQVYQFSALRLRMFYHTFRRGVVYDRARRSIHALARRGQLSDTESDDLQRYLDMRRIDDFVPGDEVFHQFCREVEQLREEAMKALWRHEMYVREATIYGPPTVRSQMLRQRSSSAASALMGRFAFYRSSSSGAGSTRSDHGTGEHPYANHSHSHSSGSSGSSTQLRSYAMVQHASLGTLNGLRDQPRKFSAAPNHVYASLLGDDFASTVQLKLVGLLFSEFHLLFRHSDTDSWLNQWLNEPSEPGTVGTPASVTPPPSGSTRRPASTPVLAATLSSASLLSTASTSSSTSSLTSSTASTTGLRPHAIASNIGITLPAAITTTATTTAFATTVTNITMNNDSNGSLPRPSVDPPSIATAASSPLLSAGLYRVHSVATLMPTGGDSTNHLSLIHSHYDVAEPLRRRRSSRSARSYCSDTPLPAVSFAGRSPGPESSTPAGLLSPRSPDPHSDIAPTDALPTVVTPADCAPPSPSPSIPSPALGHHSRQHSGSSEATGATKPSPSRKDRRAHTTPPNHAFITACSALCTQLTLHPSPFRKLHALFAFIQLITAQLAAQRTDAPNTDTIITELVRVLREVRPRYLCRDLQVMATFLPESILNMSDAGKAFVDTSVAVLALKEEVLREVVARGRALLGETDSEEEDDDEEGELTSASRTTTDSTATSSRLLQQQQQQHHHHRRNSQDEREMQLRQYEAFRLFMIAAKEGHAVGARELAILYLTLPLAPDTLRLDFDLLTPLPAAVDGASYFVSGSHTPRGDTQSEMDEFDLDYDDAATDTELDEREGVSPWLRPAPHIYGRHASGPLAASSTASLLLSAQMADRPSEKCIAANMRAAMKWFTRAARQGDLIASHYLEQHQQPLPPPPTPLRSHGFSFSTSSYAVD